MAGRYENALNHDRYSFKLYRVREDVCASGMAVGELYTYYFTPPAFCLVAPNKTDVELRFASVVRTGKAHFCHCTLFEVAHGRRAMEQCYTFQTDNGDTEDENQCPAGGMYVELTDQAAGERSLSGNPLTSTFRYNKLE